MTNLEALKAEIEPYSVSDDALTKRLIDGGLEAEEEYESGNKLAMAKCAISQLVAFLSLTNETLGPTAQSYNKEGLQERIKAICEENGLKSDAYITKPTVMVYSGLY